MLKGLWGLFFVFFLFSGCSTHPVPLTSSPLPSSATVSVPATYSTGTDKWFDAGIDVQKGTMLSIYAKGRWRLGQGPAECDANGLAKFPPYRGHLYGTLMAKIGPYGSPFPVGTRFEEKVHSAGRLFLGNNDKNPDDNTGVLNVTVETQ